jgi:hypothetical protein
MWRIAGSVVLILGGCFWIFFWFAVSVVAGADSHGAPVPGPQRSSNECGEYPL